MYDYSPEGKSLSILSRNETFSPNPNHSCICEHEGQRKTGGQAEVKTDLALDEEIALKRSRDRMTVKLPLNIKLSFKKFAYPSLDYLIFKWSLNFGS